MTKPDMMAIPDGLSDEAIEWLVRLHSGNASETDHRAFEAWRAQDGLHERAAQEAEAIWQGIGLIEAGVRKTVRKPSVPTRRAVLGGALAIAGAAGLAGSGLIGRELFADHSTGTGEQNAVTLADGSRVSMSARTAFNIDWTERERRLELVTGQATFEVAPNPSRPFVVAARRGLARAVGTVFDVDLRDADVAVTVIEGSVAVSKEAARAVTVGTDQRVKYSDDVGLGEPETVDANAETAWRRGKLIFNEKSLADVISQIERYRGGKIVVADAVLQKMTLTGVFDLRDTDAVLDAIEQTLPVRVTRLPMVTILR